MTNEITNEQFSRLAFPLLYLLDLSDEEFGALARQGSVHSEKRGSKTISRLRFRVHGQQQVRYVSPQDAAALAEELARLQRRVRAARSVRALSKLAREALHQRRSNLAPLLDARGLHFHGHQIRRYRYLTETVSFASD